MSRGKTTLPKPHRAARGQVRKPSRRAGSSEDVAEAALAAFAHEVRTPLTGILGVSELLATSDLGERERRWVSTIKTSAEHLAALATLFVDAARARKAGLTLNEEPFDLGWLADAIADALAGRAESKGLAADISIAKSAQLMVSGDAVRLRAALENLIDNAVKFTERGRVRLAIAAPRVSGGVRLTATVDDEGIGLSAREMKALFRPFAQANATISTRFGGSGLGLASARRLARAMGGDITVAARKPKGTRFVLTAMLKTIPRQRRQTKAPAGESSAATAAKPLSILCAEDNPFGRVVMNTILTELGHRVAFVEHGDAAVEAVAKGAFDVVFMDVVLPGTNGIEATRLIRALPLSVASIPVVGLSGRNNDVRAALSAGMNAFLVKPVNPRTIVSMLKVLTLDGELPLE